MAKSSLTDLYSTTSGDDREISLRDEFLGTFAGTGIEISKSRECVIRRMRLDADGKKIRCDCVSSVTQEADKESLCPICLAEGYLWDEVEDECYRMMLTPKESSFPAGLSNTPTVIFYMRHSTIIGNDDKVVELVLDTTGNAVRPFQRKGIFRVQHVETYRLDEARIEYLKIWTYREDVKHLNI